MKTLKLDQFEKFECNVSQMEKVRGGERVVVKIDVDGDGKWDIKTVTNTNTGKMKTKVRVN